jgi:hypothetical protein
VKSIVTSVFTRSLRLYFRWFCQAFTPAGRTAAPLNARRLVILLLGFPLFLLLQLCHWAFLALDNLFFPQYRQVTLTRPLFILGMPRSGTTFLHRTLALDRRQFTTFTTWETLLAPSLTQRHLIRGLAGLDKRLGAPVQRTLKMFTRQATRDLSGVHAVGLKAPEEDYLALLPAAACFILVLAFPWAPELWNLQRFHRQMPSAERRRLLAFYKSLLQRHLAFHGSQKTLLSKNAAFGSWLADLRHTFPDARFLVCVREPLTAFSSQLSSLEGGRDLFHADPQDTLFPPNFATIFEETYADLRDKVQNDPAGHHAVIDQQALKTHGLTLVPAALNRLGYALSDTPLAELQRTHHAPDEPGTGHSHAPRDYNISSASFSETVHQAYAVLQQAQTFKHHPNTMDPGKTSSATPPAAEPPANRPHHPADAPGNPAQHAQPEDRAVS